MDTAHSKSRLLLVDGDPKSLRVLDVSLKKAGFDVATATSGREALRILEASMPDLIISDTDLDEMDGFELCREIKSRTEWSKIPFIFVSGRKSIEDKIRGLELGVDDYLSKPIYIKEIGIRVRTALQRAERERMESRREGRTRFAGDLSDVGVVDLVQTIELNRKSGIIHIVNRDNRRGSIFFRDGKIIDAEVGRLSGANAVYRLFSWSEGQFAVEFKQIRRHDVVDAPMAPLLMEGMRRLDETTRLLEELPSPRTILEVDCRVLAEELADLPDEMNSVLRLCDGTRSMQEVIEDSDLADLEALSTLNKLFGSQIIFAREAPDKVGEARPSDRLAHWLSEGAAEDGAAAEEQGPSQGSTSGLELGAGDSDVVPSPTPAPLRKPQTTLRVLADDPARPAAAQPPGRSPPPKSGEETLAAALGPRQQSVDDDQRAIDFARSVDTLKGVPLDSLFGGPGLPAIQGDTDSQVGARSPKPEKAPPPATAAQDPGTAKPLGFAERVLSDDSALRASAMQEAIAEAGAKITRPHPTDRHTREYGTPDEAAAALVEEVVSGAHEPKRASAKIAEPARPSREVDWGAFGSPEAQPPSLATSEKPLTVLPSSVPDPPVTPAVEAAPLSLAAPATTPLHSPDDARAPAQPMQPETAPAPASNATAEPVSTGGAPEPPSASQPPDLATEQPPTPSREPSMSMGSDQSDEVALSVVAAPRSLRRIALFAVTAFALGAAGYLALSRNRPISPTSSPTAAPAVPSVGTPAVAEVPAPAAPAPAAEAKGTPQPRPSPVPSSAPMASTATSSTTAGGQSELRRKCVLLDDDGKGKAKAVAIACRAALDADPTDLAVMTILTRAELDRGRLVEARNLAKKIIALDPARFDAYIYLGNAEQEAGKTEDARAAYKKYLELAPNGPFARELRAILSNL